jgi:hypothetical protein
MGDAPLAPFQITVEINLGSSRADEKRFRGYGQVTGCAWHGTSVEAGRWR